MRVLGPEETAMAVRTATQAGDLESPGFAFRDQGRDIAYDWHVHEHHQLLYAISGAALLETVEARYLLPPQRAAWIPAGVRHRTILSSVDGASIFLAPSPALAGQNRVRVLAASPLLREMVIHALRWSSAQDASAPLARRYFDLLAGLCVEWIGSALPLELPRSSHPGVARAMDYALHDPGAATQAGAIAAARVSERSFRRLFLRETGIGWQAWLAQARIMAAMAMLETGALVTTVAAEVGFSSLSAFAKSFARIAGENPGAYRQRAHLRDRA